MSWERLEQIAKASVLDGSHATHKIHMPPSLIKRAFRKFAPDSDSPRYFLAQVPVMYALMGIPIFEDQSIVDPHVWILLDQDDKEIERGYCPYDIVEGDNTGEPRGFLNVEISGGGQLNLEVDDEWPQ